MQDTVCECGHWAEEHVFGYGECFSCPVESKCHKFTFSPEYNTAEAIADRGGYHWQQPCVCALCVEDIISGIDTREVI